MEGLVNRKFTQEHIIVFKLLLNLVFFEIPIEDSLCVRIRNRIGIDVAVDGLRLFYEHKTAPIRELLDYARPCHVGHIMSPYIEALQ